MYGRLGNILFSIATVFYYCKKHNIDYSNICFNADSLSIHTHKYLDNILINVKKYFVDKDKWLELTKNNIDGVYSKYKDIKHLNISFTDWSWLDFSEEKFIAELFYNEKVFHDVINNIPTHYLDYKDRIAVHVRRTDFKEFNKGSCLLSKDEILNTINNNDNKYFIFTDDIDWCKDNFKKDNCIVIDNYLTDWESMILMSYCKDIVYNRGSTYSYFSLIIKKYLSNS